MRSPGAIPPRETLPNQLLVEHAVVHAKHKEGASTLVSPLNHRLDADAGPKHRPPDCLLGLLPVRLPSLGGIDPIELYPNNLPGLAEKMHRIAVQHPVHGSQKRLAVGENRQEQKSSEQTVQESQNQSSWRQHQWIAGKSKSSLFETPGRGGAVLYTAAVVSRSSSQPVHRLYDLSLRTSLNDRVDLGLRKYGRPHNSTIDAEQPRFLSGLFRELTTAIIWEQSHPFPMFSMTPA
jgi:hypothetical protein